MTTAVTCGVVVTDGPMLLIGHATRSPRWDIPKGMAEPEERAEDAARRELSEETGLQPPERLEHLGRFAYLPRKDLELFAWVCDALPDPATLVCRSTFAAGNTVLPEFDRFACLPWADALPKLGKSMRAVLAPIAVGRQWTPRARAG